MSMWVTEYYKSIWNLIPSKHFEVEVEYTCSPWYLIMRTIATSVEIFLLHLWCQRWPLWPLFWAVTFWQHIISLNTWAVSGSYQLISSSAPHSKQHLINSVNVWRNLRAWQGPPTCPRTRRCTACQPWLQEWIQAWLSLVLVRANFLTAASLSLSNW